MTLREVLDDDEVVEMPDANVLEGEIVSTPPDKHLTGLPRERATRAGRPSGCVLWSAREARTFNGSHAIAGAYPRGFLAWALSELGAPANEVLHVCSGSLAPEVGGVRVDLRRSVAPDVVADGRRLPFRDEAFRAVLIDPPWSKTYAETLYGTDYPRPSHLLREAVRVVKPLGLIGMVHFLVPRTPRGAKQVRVHGIVAGQNYRIRALTIYRREQRSLFDDSSRKAELDQAGGGS